MSDSYFMGESIGDILGDIMGDGFMGDDMMGDEMGRRRRVQRVAKRHGMVAMTPAQAKQLVAKGAEMKADSTGVPQSLPNGRLATSGQRLEVLPLGSVALAAGVGTIATLSVNVQRPIQPYRLILQASDVTTGADALYSVGITNCVLGAHNLFASPGIIAPGTGFGRDAWGTEILSVPMAQGGVVRLDLTHLAATANALVISGMLLGYAAQG
jgi:hypothetical protein